MAATKNLVSQARLKQQYNSEFAAALRKELKLDNIHQAPRLEKIVINIGLGKANDDKKIMEVATNTLRKITGQQPIQTTASKSIAAFKLREGNKIGLKVTLRDERMYEFMDRLINIVLPRLRDFHGLSLKSFDEGGNYSLGITDQSVFPELSFDETTTSHGLQVIFVIKAATKEESRALLEKFGMPFEKPQAEPVEKPRPEPAPMPAAEETETTEETTVEEAEQETKEETNG